MGSKARIAKYILPIILENRKPEQYYIEPFAGGLNTLCLVDGLRIASDSNKYLIAMWKHLQKGGKFMRKISKEIYVLAREDYSNRTNEHYSDSAIGWIGFMASFNGRFFDGGYSGKSGGRDYIAEQIRNTEKQIPLIKGVQFFSLSYDYNCLYTQGKCIVYCDPPYKGTKQYSNSKDFDYEKFYTFCRTLKERGHTIFISEYEMPEDFKCVWEMEVTNSMHTTKTYKPIEKLFTI